jgi:hypothetical protein
MIFPIPVFPLMISRSLPNRIPEIYEPGKKKLTRNMKIKEKRRKSAENKLERAKKFALAKSLGIQFEEPTLESIAEKKKRNADNGQN